VSHNPYCIKLEPTRGCTRRCAFCTLSTVQWKDDPYQHMPMELYRAAIDELSGWLHKVRLEYEGRGEPTLHPQLLEMFAYARDRMPLAQLTLDTNGDLFKSLGEEQFGRWVQQAMQAGLNHLMLDCYDDKRFEQALRCAPTWGYEVVRYFESSNRLAKRKRVNDSPWYYWGHNHHRVYVLHAVQDNRHQTREITNHAGNLDVKYAAKMGYHLAKSVESMRRKMCVKPFRELNLYSDGQIPLCCMDWRVQGSVGTFPRTSLREAWDRMDAYRVNLLRKDRLLQWPCRNCNSRVGGLAGLEQGWFDDHSVPQPVELQPTLDRYFTEQGVPFQESLPHHLQDMIPLQPVEAAPHE